MGISLFIIIAIFVVIAVFVVLKVKKNADRKREAEIKLKNRAEQIDSELTKKGYELTYHKVNSVGEGHYQMYISLDKDDECVGNLRFGTFGSTSSFASSVGYSFSMSHAGNSYNLDTFKHIIHLDKAGIIFESEVPCSEPPPEWMKLCGKILSSSGYTISYPEWMEKYPEASKYVNVVFK